jgi:hypothetical protein
MADMLQGCGPKGSESLPELRRVETSLFQNFTAALNDALLAEHSSKPLQTPAVQTI